MGVFSANYTLFKSGDIITESQCLNNHDLWFGYPDSMASTFITKVTVSATNTYLEEIHIPWRVTAVNVVSGVRQWTIA
jgi:hypothetical protein